MAEEERRTITLGPGSVHRGTTGEVKLELEGFLLAIDNGAVGAFMQGGIGDKLVGDGKIDLIGKIIPFIQQNGLIGGVGPHSLDVTKTVEKEQLQPDFYFKTFTECEPAPPKRGMFDLVAGSGALAARRTPRSSPRAILRKREAQTAWGAAKQVPPSPSVYCLRRLPFPESQSLALRPPRNGDPSRGI